jgi:hypothetical protein
MVSLPFALNEFKKSCDLLAIQQLKRSQGLGEDHVETNHHDAV